MTVMTRKEEELLDRLIEVAGNGELVRDALLHLNATLGRPPQVQEVVVEILRRRFGAESAQPAAVK